MCFRQIMGLLPEKRKRIPTGPSKIDNPEKLAIQGTQDEEKQNKNTEKLATQGTQDEEKLNKNTTQPRETGKIEYTRRRKTKQRHNTIWVEHHYIRKQTQIT